MKNTYLIETAEILNSIEDSEEKMEFLFELGQEMEFFPKDKMTSKNKIPGCVSDAYLILEKKDKKLYFKGYSEAMILRGYFQILLKAVENLTKEQLLNNFEEELKEFLAKTEIKANLTPSRSNAFESIFRMMQKLAKNS